MCIRDRAKGSFNKKIVRRKVSIEGSVKNGSCNKKIPVTLRKAPVITCRGPLGIALTTAEDSKMKLDIAIMGTQYAVKTTVSSVGCNRCSSKKPLLFLGLAA